MDTSPLSSILSHLLLLLLSCSLVLTGMDSCYDDEGIPSRCMPKFENAAFNRSVIVSNVCGSPPEDYCMQTGSTRSCHHCDSADPQKNRNATYLTDFHNDEEPTWWQSQSMYFGVQYPNSVNLTLHLGKAFEITYVRLKFYTSRPESFAIYKRTSETAPWQPYQFYSASCRKTYGKDPKGFIRPGQEERAALCTDEFSDISPLTGGNVAFSTLEGRPSAYNFDQSPVLQDWVTATDLLISLDRLNTFGDEFFKDSKVLRSYFYAISDFSVGGRCKCNGHASECVSDEGGRLVCVCQHHTAGQDCQRCAPFYQDRPWARATADAANQCVKCNCSGHSDECVFDAEQYRGTGSGGRCLGCRGDTDGPHCERCRENFYRASASQRCTNCSCSTLGSVSLQCDTGGVCSCWPSVTGPKCDVCRPGFHSLAPGGCRLCECDDRGSVGVCSAEDGRCYCKANVEGHHCDRCRPGSFNLQQDDPEGCQSCFCFGHSLACSSSNHYMTINISSNFLQDPDGWTGEFSGDLKYRLIWKEGEVYLLPNSEEDSGFYTAPEKFLGNQLLSYGRHLSLKFSAESEELLPRTVAVVLEGSGTSVSAYLSPQPVSDLQQGQTPQSVFTLRLTEKELKPSLSTFEFRRLLYNLTALRISNAGGQNYTSQLSGVSLVSAVRWDGSSPAGAPAPWVEVCSCPLGFMGQFCELCTPGFTRETPNAGAFSPCVPCNCNQHGTCHPETGVCDCTDFTTGPACERCLDGYYGNALTGSSGDCLPCPCPGRTTCALVPETGEVVCTNCPKGQRGTRCELCEDGFYGNPLGLGGEVRPCVSCNCNGNEDSNAVGVCHHLSGRCLKCVGHTQGDHCERCQPGYYGNALDNSLPPSQKCKSCSCNPAGTSGPLDVCHPDTGSCLCLSHVTGRDCGQCEVGYFNLRPGIGCERCNCNPIGSSSSACNPITGQCLCRTGVEGKSCDSCRMGFFGFSSRGCRACNCDPMGSLSMQCHNNGTCSCRPGFVGYKCDRCEFNYFHNRLTHQCEECPVCYSLIRDQASKLKAKLQDLEKLLASYDCRNHRRRHLRYQNVMHRDQGDQGDQGGQGDQGDQGEDFLPNALEDFLAIQEAREAFISQFTVLQTSAQTLQLQLRSVSTAMNCTFVGEREVEEEEKTTECKVLTATYAEVSKTQSQLEQATLDLNSMVIPFAIPKGPNQWNAVVNESRELVKSHRESATHIELIASNALKASNRTYIFLQNLLNNNSTEEHIQDLEEQLTGMQQMKENLTVKVDQTLALHTLVQKQNDDAAAILLNITSSLPELYQAARNTTSQLDSNNTSSSQPQNQTDVTTVGNHTQIQSPDLADRSAELDTAVQSKEQLVNATRDEMQSQIETSHRNLKTIQDFHELKYLAEGLKAEALSSVVTGKEAESGTIALRRDLEGMQREWSQVQSQSKVIQKKERVIEDKILADARKRMKQGERAIKPALENATLALDTAKQAESSANSALKHGKSVFTQSKQTKKSSAQLASSIHATVQQLTEQESRAAQTQTQLLSDTQGEEELSLETITSSMESAKNQLESYTRTLTELLSKLNGNNEVEKFDRILNETAVRLLILRRSVESPALGGKIQTLRDAAQKQQKQLLHLDQSLQEIRAERDSLRDIAENLPKNCPQK
ncbi:laminin subunit gamma-3 [Chanos chanos]|uniref:Laminin subunit gamma-3 n=1 Tax=Chanos chanos TaxID=29144 RepID=A0A6J2VD23_CHACN|nr:laminin subunit gamma-3 [Chanos chanos]